MARREIRIHDRSQRVLTFRKLCPARDRTIERLGAGLCRKVILRGELAIETPVGQPCALHDVGDADAVETLFAKQPAGHLDDPRPVFRRPLPAHFHVTAPFLLLVGLDKIYDNHHQ